MFSSYSKWHPVGIYYVLYGNGLDIFLVDQTDDRPDEFLAKFLKMDVRPFARWRDVLRNIVGGRKKEETLIHQWTTIGCWWWWWPTLSSGQPMVADDGDDPH